MATNVLVAVDKQGHVCLELFVDGEYQSIQLSSSAAIEIAKKLRSAATDAMDFAYPNTLFVSASLH